MTPVEHMIAWIESSRPHYERLLKLERDRKSRPASIQWHAFVASSIVASAFAEATRGGDMFASEWTAADLLDAAKALLSWELEQ